MKRVATVIFFLSSLPCYAQSSLSDQINAVSNAQDQNQEAQIIQQRRENAVIERQRAADRAERKRQEDANRAANQKQTDFEDTQRQIIIQEEKIKIQEEQTEADRQNDAINHNLKQQDAQTDLIQSQADSNRNVSSGTETLLKDDGKANVNNSGGLFGH